MKGFKQTEVGVIPEDWDLKRLGDITDNFDKKRKPISGIEREKIKGKYPYCGANGIVDYINSYIFDGEYVLLAEDGGYWGSGENSSYLMEGKFWVNNHAHIIAAKEGLTINYFLMYMLNFLNIDPFIGGDARGKLTQAIMNSLAIPLPPIQEQVGIAHILSKIKSAIETQERIIQTTTELKKALMQKLFTEGLKGESQKETEIGRVPKSWDVVMLVDVCEPPQYGFTDSASKQGNAKFLRITDIKEFGVNWDTVPYCNCPDIAKCVLKDNDIVVARIGATTGKSYIIKNPPISVFASYLIRLRAKPKLNANYLYHFCNSPMYWRQINANKNNNLKKGVSGSVLKTVLLPYPPIEEQNQIANAFEQISEKCAMALKKKIILDSLFKSMLHPLMTGQTRVKDIKFS